MFRYTILLLVLLTLPLRANLGDDVKQLIVRYGTPVNFTEANSTFPFGTVVFKAGGYILVVFLVGEKEVGAKVSKTNQSAFTDSERDTIMSTDVAGSQWTSVPSPDPTCLQWNRGDKATALYDKQKNVLIFTSDVMAQTLKAFHPAAPAPAPAPTPSSGLVMPPPP
jgi:hypothetical protein